MSGKNTNLQYYKCMECNYSLPTANYNYEDHSCFANFDQENDKLYVNNANQIYLARSNTTVPDDAALAEDDLMLMDEGNSCSAASLEQTKRRKYDSTWANHDELLISAIRNEPCIWNFMLPIQDRGPLKVADAWTRIEANVDGIFEVKELKKRWRNLRDSYKKATKKYNTYIASGSGSDATSKISFRYFEHMKFLDDLHITAEPTLSNVAQPNDEQHRSSLDNVDFDEENSSCHQSVTSSITAKSKSTKRSRSIAASDNFEDNIVKFLNTPTQRRNIGFFDSVEDMMRELPVSVRIELQINILKLTLQKYNAYCVQNRDT